MRILPSFADYEDYGNCVRELRKQRLAQEMSAYAECIKEILAEIRAREARAKEEICPHCKKIISSI